MSLDELKDKHAGSVETASEAFHELCAMVEALEASKLSFILWLNQDFQTINLWSYE